MTFSKDELDIFYRVLSRYLKYLYNERDVSNTMDEAEYLKYRSSRIVDPMIVYIRDIIGMKIFKNPYKFLKDDVVKDLAKYLIKNA